MSNIKIEAGKPPFRPPWQSSAPSILKLLTNIESFSRRKQPTYSRFAGRHHHVVTLLLIEISGDASQLPGHAPWGADENSADPVEYNPHVALHQVHGETCFLVSIHLHAACAKPISRSLVPHAKERLLQIFKFQSEKMLRR